jgi:hypothetical protein
VTVCRYASGCVRLFFALVLWNAINMVSVGLQVYARLLCVWNAAHRDS